MKTKSKPKGGGGQPPLVILIHWKAAEAAPRLAALRESGWTAELLAPQSSAALREAAARQPAAFVIDLSRQPSVGAACAIDLRRRASTRHTPIVFLGGLPAKVERTRALLPDAVYGDWAQARELIGRALDSKPEHPVVPDTMAGYSGTPLAKKLGIKAGSRVLLAGAPDGFEETLGELPEGARLERERRGSFQMVMLFAAGRLDLVEGFESATSRIAPKGHLWIAWPKRTSPLAADLTQDFVRAYGLDRLWVDFKICAIDADWSGLCFARR